MRRSELHADVDQATLQPGQAVAVLNERVKRVGKVNGEIADWLSVGDDASCVRLALTGIRNVARSRRCTCKA